MERLRNEDGCRYSRCDYSNCCNWLGDCRLTLSNRGCLDVVGDSLVRRLFRRHRATLPPLAPAIEGPVVNPGRKRSGRLVFGDATDEEFIDYRVQQECYRRQLEWAREHFGPRAYPVGYCVCGRHMREGEYSYFGGIFGYYLCSRCGQEWEVDLNGAMWPRARV